MCFAPGSLLSPEQCPGRHALSSSPFYRWGARDPGQGFELGLWLRICLDLPVSVTSYSRLSKGQCQAGAQGDRGRGAAFLWAGFIRTRLEGCTGSGSPDWTRRWFLLCRVGRGDLLAGTVVTAPQPSGCVSEPRKKLALQLLDIPSYPGEGSAPNPRLPVNSRANPASPSEERSDPRPYHGFPGRRHQVAFLPVIGMGGARPH